MIDKTDIVASLNAALAKIERVIVVLSALRIRVAHHKDPPGIEELINELTAYQVGDSNESIIGTDGMQQLVALRRIESEDLRMQRVASYERLSDVYGHARIHVPARWIAHGEYARGESETIVGALAAMDAEQRDRERADKADRDYERGLEAMRRVEVDGFEVRRDGDMWYVRPRGTDLWYEWATLADALDAYDLAVKS